ncbi:unnamed protein product [Urochloa humidicola]
MASRGRRILPGLEGTDPDRPPPPLTSDLHEEIFLRVASPADLARASAACVSFRRLISDPDFLRRHWHPRDARDGRVLLKRRSITNEEIRFDLAVCDPLFRRYLLLPPMTDDLLASVDLQNNYMICSGASFVPSGDMEESSFSVIRWVLSDTKFVVFFFSSGSGHWTVGTSISLDDLGLFEDDVNVVSGKCMYGCFYWKVNYTEKLLKLDMSTMELTTYDFPPNHGGDIIVVDSGEGNVAMFSQLNAGTSVDYYNLLQNGTERSHEWHMRSTIQLPDRYTSESYINGPAEGYIFLAGKEEDATHSTFFSLEIKSLKIERVCMKTSFHSAIPYFGFPPSMSSRRIQ